MNRTSYRNIQLLLLLALPAALAGCSAAGRTATNTPIRDPVASKNDAISSDQTDSAETQILRIYQHSAKNRPEQAVQTGRYSALAAIPTDAQRHPLEVIIDVRIPDDILTIKETIHYLLRRSGYTLNAVLAPDVVQLLDKPLPDVHRNLGPMTLNEALTVLTTPDFVPAEDPHTRMISYHLISDPTGAH